MTPIERLKAYCNICESPHREELQSDIRALIKVAEAAKAYVWECEHTTERLANQARDRLEYALKGVE